MLTVPEAGSSRGQQGWSLPRPLPSACRQPSPPRVLACSFLCVRCCVYSDMHRLCNPMDRGPAGCSVRGFSRQEYWSGLPFPPPGDRPHPGMIKFASPASPELAGGFFTRAAGKPFLRKCSVSISSSHKDTGHVELESLLRPHFSLTTSLKTPSPCIF